MAERRSQAKHTRSAVNEISIPRRRQAGEILTRQTNYTRDNGSMTLDVKSAVDASPWGLGNDAATWNGAPYAFVATHGSIWDSEERTPLVDEQKAKIGRLISNDEMKNVWESLKKRETSMAPSLNPWVVLYHQIRSGLKECSAEPKWSTTEFLNTYANIKHQSRQLAVDLRKLCDNELTDVTGFLDSSTLRNLAISLRLDILENPPADVDPEHALKLRLRSLPSLPDLLDLVAKRLPDLKAQRTQMQSRPASVGAQCRPFIHHMSNYFLSRYGNRLHPTVATITSVIFNRKVSADLVRKQLKSRPPR